MKKNKMEFVKAEIFGLMCECPCQIFLKTCPFQKYRKMELKTRWKALKEMDCLEARNIYLKHRNHQSEL